MINLKYYLEQIDNEDSKQTILNQINNITIQIEKFDIKFKAFKASFGSITSEQEKFYQEANEKLIQLTNSIIELQYNINSKI
jgi:hypothetical protein